jgi:hypothetical protein
MGASFSVTTLEDWQTLALATIPAFLNGSKSVVL